MITVGIVNHHGRSHDREGGDSTRLTLTSWAGASCRASTNSTRDAVYSPEFKQDSTAVS